MTGKPVAKGIRLTNIDSDGTTVTVDAGSSGTHYRVAAESDPIGDGLDPQRFTVPVSGLDQMTGGDRVPAGEDSISVTIDIADLDPVAAYPLTGGFAGHPPTPGAYRAEWWPASVRITGRPEPIPLAKVYATREGLYVYTEPPSTGDPNGTHPEFYSPINYNETPRPATGYAARQAGIRLVTGVGPVIVQPLQGCGCTKRALGSWRPGWGSHIEPWEG